MSTYDFETPTERRGTGSSKWQRFPDALPFWVADMDFKSPPEVIAALHERVDHGVFGYTDPYPEVVDEVLAYIERVHGWRAEPEWLVWLPGLVQGLNLSCRAVGSPGDQVMTTVPVYPPFLTAPPWSDRELVKVPLVENGPRWTSTR